MPVALKLGKDLTLLLICPVVMVIAFMVDLVLLLSVIVGIQFAFELWGQLLLHKVGASISLTVLGVEGW